jgi:hypothetical protein
MAERIADRLELQDKVIRDWARLTTQQLKRQLLSMGVHSRVRLERGRTDDPLVDSVGYALKKRDGQIYAIPLKFVRHGIFLEHGVGRNRPARSLAAQRSKKPWLSVVLPSRIEALAEVLSEAAATEVANEIRFLIPGIIDTKIRK